MQLYVELVLFASARLRCSARAMEIVMRFLGLPAGSPCWSCGRLWVLRLGYFKLTRAKEQATDWAWIIDHTVQVGSDKCFVILGIRLSSLPPRGKCLCHEDVEPISLHPVRESNGQIVFEQLEEAARKTGVPRQIIGDHGTDLLLGVEMFLKEHPESCATYDIKHKTASILKRELKADARWLSFSSMCAKSAERLRQTDLAHLSPPNQRSKSRYMNIDVLIGWGSKVVCFLDAPLLDKEISPGELDAKLGWMRDYRDEIARWEALFSVIGEAESFVRKEGLYRKCHRDLQTRLDPLARTDQSKRIACELTRFVAEECFKAKPGERLLGSSEVIESVFGKLKYMEGNQAMSGFTALVLSLAAMVSKTTGEIVRKAMETVRTKDMLEWCRTTLAKSVQAKRRAITLACKPEQNRDEIQAAAGT